MPVSSLVPKHVQTLDLTHSGKHIHSYALLCACSLLGVIPYVEHTATTNGVKDPLPSWFFYFLQEKTHM